MDLDSLYKACKWHTLRATVFTALKSAGAEHSDFFQAYNKAVRKNILFDSEREAITSEMEKQGIWYLPLKGAILKELYPQIGMREMSDNDIKLGQIMSLHSDILPKAWEIATPTSIRSPPCLIWKCTERYSFSVMTKSFSDTTKT